MHTLFPPLVETSDENAPRADGDDDVLSQELKDNFESMRAILRAQQNRECDFSEKRKEAQAVKTALSVEAEIARLESGIEELEALLEVGDVPLVAFPSLPPVVPDEPNNESEEAEKKKGELVQG